MHSCVQITVAAADLSTEDILTCHSRNSAVVIDNMSHSCVPFRCSSFRVTLLWLAWLTGRLPWKSSLMLTITSHLWDPFQLCHNYQVSRTHSEIQQLKKGKCTHQTFPLGNRANMQQYFTKPAVKNLNNEHETFQPSQTAPITPAHSWTTSGRPQGERSTSRGQVLH